MSNSKVAAQTEAQLLKQRKIQQQHQALLHQEAIDLTNFIYWHGKRSATIKAREVSNTQLAEEAGGTLHSSGSDTGVPAISEVSVSVS